MTVLVLEDAAAELEAGRRFYESRQQGVGDYCVECLLSDLESVVLHAGIHRRHFGLQWVLSKRFPFGIYYDIEGDTACVYAILDMRRDPVWLRTELSRRT
jgi:hypothetical protein